MTEHKWQRSSFSPDGGNNCVEIAALDDRIALRESDTPTTILTTHQPALNALLRSMKAGTLRPSGCPSDT